MASSAACEEDECDGQMVVSLFPCFPAAAAAAPVISTTRNLYVLVCERLAHMMTPLTKHLLQECTANAVHMVIYPPTCCCISSRG